jgi:cystathionine beta-lyase
MWAMPTSEPPDAASDIDAATDPLFADCPDRHATGSEKWDRWAGRPTADGREVIPVWVADMDFVAPQEVLDAIHARVDHGVFGYTADPPGFAPALTEHLERVHGWVIDPARVVGTPGVVTGLALAARMLTKPDDEILTFAPIYPPFLSLPRAAARHSLRVPLAGCGDAWEVDFDALEQAVSPRTTMLWLCHPQNPTGMIHSRDELLAIAEFAWHRGIRVVSDEIWADLVLDGSPHTPFASLDHPAAEAAITLVAPSKTWNIAGLDCAAAILPEAAMKSRWRPSGGGLVPMVNPLGYAAAEAAWRHGDPWRRRLLAVLRHHMGLVGETVAETPGLAWIPPRATYLAWIDCRATGVADPQAACEAVGLGTSDGRDFGAPGFVRINTACPTPRLEEALRRLREAFAGG